MASLDSLPPNLLNQTVVNQIAKSPVPGKSFAQILSGELSGDPSLAQLPPKVVLGSSVRVKISRSAYESGLAACKTHLHGRLTLRKGDTPLTTQALKAKLSIQWPQLQNWNLIALGKGFFELRFNSIEDMRRIWALGAVNLKPGLMRFYCWSKDFTPQAQSQTHAQVWVRFLNLPQEYWEKQTLFEIASGLGTPLSIDEATLDRRFGIFARILIDVDLSETLFESVVVEREDHALSISIQYEKHPLFCAHCKMIGHSFQTCVKLGASIPTQKKPHIGPAKNKPATLTKPVSASDIQVEKDAQTAVKVQKASVTELEDGVIAHINTDQELGSVHKPDDNPALHNAFTLLEPEIEQGIDDEVPTDKEFPPTELDMQIDKNPGVKETPQGMKQLTQNTTLENPWKLVNRHSKTVDMSSITSPVSLGNKKAIGPAVDEVTILQPIISPINTRDETLGQDKRQVHIAVGPRNTAAVCLKDGKLLSKFWGDADNDDTDSNPETDTDIHQSSSPTFSKYIVPDTVTKSKRGRPKKQRSLQKKGRSKSPEQGKENIHTRSQTGSKIQNTNKHTQ